MKQLKRFWKCWLIFDFCLIFFVDFLPSPIKEKSDLPCS